MMFEQSLVSILRLPRKVLVARAAMLATFATALIAVASAVQSHAVRLSGKCETAPRCLKLQDFL